MAIDPGISSAVDEAIVGLDLSVYDIEWAGRILRISLDRQGGVDLDSLAEANRRIGAALDLAELIAGAYQLEVASPGLERNLRTPAHWAAAVGEPVKIKTRPDADGNRRVDGVVQSCDNSSVTVLVDGSPVTVGFAEIDRARTVFEWGPAPKPGGAKSKGRPAPRTRNGAGA